MKIKKFIATTLQEGKALVLKELGDDAVILSSRNVKKPGSSQEFVEIVAAIDETPSNSPQKSILLKQKELAARNSEPKETSDDFLLIANQIQYEIIDLKDSLQKSFENAKYPIKNIIGNDLGNIYKKLIEIGFSDYYVNSLIGKCIEKGITDYHNGFELTKRLILDKVFLNLNLGKNKNRIINFIGSTGCGKTTALIKLAIVSKLIFETDVSVYSADIYKIGGSEQLQTLCSIANIPFKSVYTAEELKTSVEKENPNTQIFIDTFGASNLNTGKIKEIKELFSEIKVDETYLVLSITNRNSVINSSIKNFGVLEPTGLILTKSDEVEQFGSFFENLNNVKIPICYITSGQRIPDDIEPATKDLINSMIFNNKEDF
ncbi:MAG TPA: hypothetical protein PK762_04815 [Candidatus Kapabacteria bacterium]|nr:hypothetical protein [Candidatus Kapabacteria bacterium]